MLRKEIVVTGCQIVVGNFSVYSQCIFGFFFAVRQQISPVYASLLLMLRCDFLLLLRCCALLLFRFVLCFEFQKKNVLSFLRRLVNICVMSHTHKVTVNSSQHHIFSNLTQFAKDRTARRHQMTFPSTGPKQSSETHVDVIYFNPSHRNFVVLCFDQNVETRFP